VHQCTEEQPIQNTYEGYQGNPKGAHLLDYTLRCAIWASCDNPVVGPSDIEDTANRLQKVVYKKEELSHGYNKTNARVSYGKMKRTMYMSVGVRNSFQSPFGRVFL
jgi:hypothetical protein